MLLINILKLVKIMTDFFVLKVMKLGGTLMSAICGVITFDQNIDVKKMGSNMLEDLKIYTYDKISEFERDNIYFGCGLQCITPESMHEILPNYDNERKLLITADAIIDNRDELFEVFRIPKEFWETTTDTDLILMAYDKWGNDCPKYLIGNFAFAIWNENKKELFCARDHVGTRTLYYINSNHMFAFCTLEKPLLRVSSSAIELNERWITDFLAIDSLINETDTHETLYKSIYQVPPACSITFDINGLKKSIYWEPLKNIKPLKLKSDKEYEEAFRKIFNQAVECCLRTTGKVGVMLSGGLDSVSVASVAAKILSEQNKKLTSFTSVPLKDFNENVPSYKVVDESKEVNLVCEKYRNIESNFIRCENRNSISDIDSVISILEQPYKIVQNIYWILEIFETASKKDCKVLLNGHWGNVTISYGRLRVLILTLFRKGKFLTLYKEIKALKKLNGAPALLLFKDLIKICMPYKLKVAMGLIKTKNNKNDRFNNVIVNRELVKKWNVEKRFDKLGYNDLTNPNLDMYEELKLLYCPNNLNHIGTIDKKMSLAHGIIVRDPTRDVRVIEFCLSLPGEQFLRNGMDRSLIRRTMEGIIPEEIRMNLLKKGTQGYDWRKRLEPDWKKVRLELVELLNNKDIRYYIDTDKLKNDFEIIGQSLKLENSNNVLNTIMSIVLYRFLIEYSKKYKSKELPAS